MPALPFFSGDTVALVELERFWANTRGQWPAVALLGAPAGCAITDAKVTYLESARLAIWSLKKNEMPAAGRILGDFR